MPSPTLKRYQAAASQPVPRAPRAHEMIGDFVTEGSILGPEDVPPLTTGRERTFWLAERIAGGLYHTDDKATLAEAWSVAEPTIGNYAHTASMIVEALTSDATKLVNLAATRLHRLAASDSLEPRDQLAAIKLVMQLHGRLSGGVARTGDEPTPTETAAQMVAALRDPDDEMMEWMREAFSDPGPGLRALLEEFRVIETEGETER